MTPRSVGGARILVTVDSLFDDRPRSDTSFKDPSETEWEFLDRTGRPWGDPVRRFWSAALANFGTREDQVRLRSRLRSRDGVEVRSAAFELLVHEVLKQLGLPAEIEARPDGHAKRPDFRVRAADTDVWVEATLANPSDAEVRRARSIAELRARLDRIPVRDFWVSLQIERVGDVGGSGPALVARDLSEWLRDRRDVLRARLRQSAPVEGREVAFDQHGWALKIRVEGTRPEACASGPIVQIWSEAARPVDHAARIRSRVREKADKYREIPGAHLIAVNSTFDGVDDADVMDALFGNELTLMRYVEDRVEVAGTGRAPVAAWLFQREFCSRSVSAVAIFRNVGFASLAGAIPTLVHHPAAAVKLPQVNWPFEEWVPNLATRAFDRRPGRTLGEVLGLPAGWPDAGQAAAHAIAAQ